jgi:hypothetical protein
LAKTGTHPYKLTSKIPYEITNLNNFSVAKLERYFLIISILETNLAEYVKLRATVDEVLTEIQNVNNDEIQSGEEDEDDFSDFDEDGSESEDGQLEIPDALFAFSMDNAARSKSRVEINR